jgi:hypothetical protein
VRAKREWKSRSAGTGAARRRERSSDRKNVLREVTTALKATKERKVRKSQLRPSRIR